MPNRPTLMGALIYMEDEYTKSDVKLDLKESGKEGLKVDVKKGREAEKKLSLNSGSDKK